MHKYLFILKSTLFIYLFHINNLHSQCTISSSCGYDIHVDIGKLAIVPSSTACPFGYNYNVRFSYTITISGINTCYNGNIGIQPQIICNTQNNGYYTINVPAPTVGAGYTTTNYYGTLTTGSNPYISSSTCNSATPSSLGCNSMQLTIFGPGISSTTYPCSISTLPIELVNFVAEEQNESVELKWITASEVNNDFFTIERAIDGINFQNIGIVKGAGNSVKEIYYYLQDRKPLTGISYYRLKQTDFDKKESYSVIQSISIDAKNTFDFMLFPNPSDKNEDIRLVFYGKENDVLNLSITDITGKLLAEKNIKLSASSQEVNLKHHFDAGIYFVKVSNKDGKIINQKFIIQ